MKLIKVLTAIMLIMALTSCQSELTQEEPGTIPPEEISGPESISVKAFVPGTDNTRAQITYGYPEVSEEIFMWNKKDYITLFNISRLDECPDGVELEEVYISENRKVAKFQAYDLPSVNNGSKFKIYNGDVLFAVTGEALRQMGKDDNEEIFYDKRNIIKLGLGAQANKPQMVVDNPTLLADQDYMNSTLEYMQHNLRMFAIVTVKEDGVVPDLYFNHMSAIFRVTVRNMTGENFYPTKIELQYPGNEVFYATTLCLSVKGDKNEVSSLEVHTTDDLYPKDSKRYTDNIGTTVNSKDDTEDKGGVIPNGSSYDLYLTAIPKLSNGVAGSEGISIGLVKNHLTKITYTINIPNFDKVIEAGKRYWFKVTATPDGKLMLNSEWDKLHPQNNE